jgi:hypothetical protein
VLTAIAAVVFTASKFTQGAWLLFLIIPLLWWMFARVESYYRDAGQQALAPSRTHRVGPKVNEL